MSVTNPLLTTGPVLPVPLELIGIHEVPPVELLPSFLKPVMPIDDPGNSLSGSRREPERHLILFVLNNLCHKTIVVDVLESAGRFGSAEAERQELLAEQINSERLHSFSF